MDKTSWTFFIIISRKRKKRQVKRFWKYQLKRHALSNPWLFKFPPFFVPENPPPIFQASVLSFCFAVSFCFLLIFSSSLFPTFCLSVFLSFSSSLSLSFFLSFYLFIFLSFCLSDFFSNILKELGSGGYNQSFSVPSPLFEESLDNLTAGTYRKFFRAALNSYNLLIKIKKTHKITK